MEETGSYINLLKNMVYIFVLIFNSLYIFQFLLVVLISPLAFILKVFYIFLFYRSIKSIFSLSLLELRKLMDFPGSSAGKESTYNAEALVQFLGWEDPLEKRDRLPIPIFLGFTNWLRPGS